MKLNKSLVAGLVVTMISSFSLLACSEKTEVREDTSKPATVVVPDTNKDVNVNVHTDTAPAAPAAVDSNTTTTTQNTDTGSVQTKSETTTVH